MRTSISANRKDDPLRKLEESTFLALVCLSTVAFLWLLWPFSGAILWGTVLAIVFAPVYRGLLTAFSMRQSIAAAVTILIILLIVMLPLAAITAALVREVSTFYERVQTGEIDFEIYFKGITDALPVWVMDLLRRFGVEDIASTQQTLARAFQQGSQYITGKLMNIGQSTVQFVINLGVMFYLLFFLLRDGDQLSSRIRNAVPLPAERQNALFDKFAAVVRATVKGDILVSMLQGTLGGLIFWFLDIHAAILWGVLMAFLSLLPAVGAAIVWFPVAIYLLSTGAVWKGIVLIAFGALVIGLIDNLVRPALVGKDTKMPDYVVLISTLGGIELFGLNGFVIGPVIAATFITVWGIFSQSRQTASE